jgi:hypothetical protein
MAHYDHDYSAPDNKMSPEERLIQWLKIVFALIGGSYFVWWSLSVLARLDQLV